MTKLVPQFGVYTPEQTIALHIVLSKLWRLNPTPMGTAASPEFFEMFPFKEDLDIPFFVFNSEQLKGLVPNYDNVRKNRAGLRVIICFVETEDIKEVSNDTNKPDFYIDLKNQQLIIM
jgi:hypothetical protein